MLTNARSLSPKIQSLQTMFEEQELDVAMITESWLRDGSVLNSDIIDLEYGTNLKIVYKNRPKRRAGARTVGGGVSIIYNKSRCSFRERKIVGNKFELVAAVGRIGKISRPVALFCLYLEPQMKAAELKELNELLWDQILQLKSASEHIIFLGGDLNNKCISPAVQNFIDISQSNFDPTRGQACLDIMFSNCSSITSSVWPPLHTLAGIRSDHGCVLLECREPAEKNFTWSKKTVRKQTDRACQAFADDVRRVDWEAALAPDDGPDDMVACFEGILAPLVDKHFPLVTYRCRSNEPEWITHGIQRNSKLKKRVYKREGKSRLWHSLEARGRALTESSKDNFIQTSEAAGPKAYYRAVKNLAINGKKPEWDLMDLFPGKTPSEAGEEAAAYFTRISDAFDPLPATNAAPESLRRPVTLPEVQKALKDARKPDSMVEGDVMPRLMREYHHLFSVPAMKIFNAVFRTGTWPDKWKTETTVIIPKTANPSSLAECRNISCTPFLSKVLESIMLADLRREIPDDEIQYGGLKSFSVDHLLTDLYEKILAPLDSSNPAVVMGIDFEKAFNRLDHRACLRELRRLGASPASLAIVRSFLTGRKMRVKIGGILSECRTLCGGSPQGSILGCLLYCLATQQLNGDLLPAPRPAALPHVRPDSSTHEPQPEEADPPGDGFGLLENAGAPVLLSPLPDVHPEGAAVLGEEGEEVLPGIFVFKYINDTTTVEIVDKNRAIKHVKLLISTENVPADLTLGLLGEIITRAESIGMLINCKKTQLLCVSADNGYSSSSALQVGQESISSAQSMTLLGFRIGSRPGVHDQVAFIKDKFRRKFWSLIHLKQAGLSGMRLFKLYVVFVRPVIECNSVVYHSMLGKVQSSEIERLQQLVVTLCFGHHVGYARTIEELGIKTLAERRMEAVKRFVGKALLNRRLSSRWFVPRPEANQQLRSRNTFVEKRARTERYYRSPLLHFQRVANELRTTRSNL